MKKHETRALKRGKHWYPVIALTNDSSLATGNSTFIVTSVQKTKIWSKVGPQSLGSPMSSSSSLHPLACGREHSNKYPCLTLSSPVCSHLLVFSSYNTCQWIQAHQVIPRTFFCQDPLLKRVRILPLIGFQHTGMFWLVYLWSRPLKLSPSSAASLPHVLPTGSRKLLR